jgi:uncharacterized protein with NRDE domain
MAWSYCCINFLNYSFKMCIAFFVIGSGSLPLILAFNRDEVTYRPAEPAQYVTADILCGVDVQTGSTWLGVNKATGAVCFLTNYRTPANYAGEKRYQSRGHLVLNYLKGEGFHPQEAVNTRGFNIVYGNAKTGEFFYFQHRNDGGAYKEPIKLEVDRVYGLSNGDLD